MVSIVEAWVRVHDARKHSSNQCLPYLFYGVSVLIGANPEKAGGERVLWQKSAKLVRNWYTIHGCIHY